MLAQIHVTFKEGVLDPQGKTVHHALNDLGYDEVLDVNIGKYLEIKLDSASEEEAEEAEDDSDWEEAELEEAEWEEDDEEEGEEEEYADSA